MEPRKLLVGAVAKDEALLLPSTHSLSHPTGPALYMRALADVELGGYEPATNPNPAVDSPEAIPVSRLALRSCLRKQTQKRLKRSDQAWVA